MRCLDVILGMNDMVEYPLTLTLYNLIPLLVLV
jgi:hypothetical protein